jgi:hypothetical protein
MLETAIGVCAAVALLLLSAIVAAFYCTTQLYAVGKE